MSKISKAVFLINSQPNVDVLTQWLTKRRSEKGKHPDAHRATRSLLGRPARESLCIYSVNDLVECLSRKDKESDNNDKEGNEQKGERNTTHKTLQFRAVCAALVLIHLYNKGIRVSSKEGSQRD